MLLVVGGMSGAFSTETDEKCHSEEGSEKDFQREFDIYHL